ncbi:MAG: WG repeat-containing protein [Acutalibacteraceae bacterium]
MKNNKILAIVALIFLNIIAGYLVFTGTFGGASKFDRTVEKAQYYYDHKLYAKSVEKYDEALAIKDSVDVCIAKINVYDAGLEYGEFTSTVDIDTDLDEMIKDYYKETKVYERACEFYLKYEEYESCVDCLKQAKSRGLKSDKLNELTEKIRYTFETDYTMYNHVYSECNKTYVVETNGACSIIKANGENAIPGTYIWATNFSNAITVGDDTFKYAIVSKFDSKGNKITYIVDNNGTKLLYLDSAVTGASPIVSVNTGKNETSLIFSGRTGDKYYFYKFDPTSETVKQLSGPYMFAGTYRNNVAPVQISKNEWKLINGDGKQIGSTFTDIVVNDAGECAPKNLIFAAENGKHHLYKLEGEKLSAVGNLTCDGAKAFVDGTFAAVKFGDKWGYVDSKGKVVINAKYEEARSFSCGLAGVKENGVWNFINEKGTTVINTGFDNVVDFGTSGKCFVEAKGYWSSIQLYYVDEAKG